MQSTLIENGGVFVCLHVCVYVCVCDTALILLLLFHNTDCSLLDARMGFWHPAFYVFQYVHVSVSVSVHVPAKRCEMCKSAELVQMLMKHVKSSA